MRTEREVTGEVDEGRWRSSTKKKNKDGVHAREMVVVVA